MSQRPFTAILIIPTGIGAAIGGFAGDAIPLVRAIAEVCDRLITHPNVLNGAQLYWPHPKVSYVEGYGLDKFAAGNWGLQPVRQNRIGIIFDQAIEADLRWRHLQAADACRATLGLNLTDYVVTDAPLDVRLQSAASGATWGTISQPDSLLRAAEHLITTAKSEAVAVVARFPDDLGSEALQNYRQGQGVDPLAGAEAVISHLIVRQFQIPCAHAPALQPLPLDPSVNPRAAAEEVGYTFLPSVLVGLSRAPQFTLNRSNSNVNGIWREEVDALVIPASACGGSAVLSLSRTNTKIITVAQNSTTLDVTASRLGIPAMPVQTYLEAIGTLAALKAGVDLRMFNPKISALRPLANKKPDR